jgi:hypothetical protein
MKLTNIAIDFAISEKDWDTAIRLLASMFPLHGVGDAIASHGVSMSIMPSWDVQQIQIRWQNNIYLLKHGKGSTEHYPVYYPTPIAIIYCHGV